jgi:DNA polymerase I-like protein with 3'-5' exonuclease and polymerase domains
MDVITIDFETYYDKEFSLSKITTEEYVRDPRFEIIGVGVKVNNEKTRFFSGEHELLRQQLLRYDWDNSMVVAHNAMFDMSILNWVLGIKPKAIADTLSMARAIHGTEVGNSLAKLVKHYDLGEKGDEVINALGIRRTKFPDHQMKLYAKYCVNDVDLTYDLFLTLLPMFQKVELKLIDLTVRMFTEPVLRLDVPVLEQHLVHVKKRKQNLIDSTMTGIDNLMSNQKFAKLLEELGVEPPMKISLTTGKETLALAKSDEGFKALAEHPDERVQLLVAARLGNKSTLEETRTERLLGIASRGLIPVPLSYYAAHTGRWGGADKLNFQNLPSRGDNAGKIKRSILAPEGHVMIDCDSAQIEARVLAWFAGQIDLVEAFRDGKDVYKIMASAIYNKDVQEIDKGERFVGKTTILGAGYGMGADKFKTQLKTFGVETPLEEAKRIIDVYRETYPWIPSLWQSGNKAIEALSKGRTATWGNGVVTIGKDGVLMPNGMYQRYPNLKKVKDKDGKEQYIYDSRRGSVKLYGGKLTENICQGLARCIIGEQMLKISKRYRVVLTVHDAVACVAPTEEAVEAVAYVEECMRFVPEWAQGIPLNCESGFGASYGDC